jgi:hypothetical protein
MRRFARLRIWHSWSHRRATPYFDDDLATWHLFPDHEERTRDAVDAILGPALVAIRTA